MKLRHLIILAGLLILVGCATLNKEECQKADWRDIGFKDGVNGELTARIAKHREACAEHGYQPDEKLYMAGRTEGLREYCQVDNAFQTGLKGKQYNGVCASNIDMLFSRYNRAAYKVYETREAIKNKHNSISAAQNRLENKKTPDSSKSHIRSDIRKMESEVDKLRNDLRDQERELDRLMAEARDSKRKIQQETDSRPAPLLNKTKLPDPLPSVKKEKKLPAGGGAPGKAYNAYHKAIKNKDITAYRRTTLQGQDMSDSDIKKMIDIANSFGPFSAKITRGYVKGDWAVLYVERIVGGKKWDGVAELVEKGKIWLVVSDSWGVQPPRK